MVEEYPKTAFILTLIGSVLALIIGIPMAILGAAIGSLLGGALGGSICVVITLLGAVLGITGAVLMRNPNKAKAGGALAIIGAFLGGYGIISFILMLIGGIMALTWEPPKKMMPPPPPPM